MKAQPNDALKRMTFTFTTRQTSHSQYFSKLESALFIVDNVKDDDVCFMKQQALADAWEPTPFHEDAFLEASTESNKSFVVAQSTIAEPLRARSKSDADWYSALQTTMDCMINNSLEVNRRCLSDLSKSRKRSKSPCVPPAKRMRFDPDLPTSREDDQPHKDIDSMSFYFNDDEEELNVKSSKFRPHQETRWDEHFAALLKFRARHGHCSVPHSYNEDPALSRWAKRQRYQYNLKIQDKESTLSEDRQQKLEAVGFVWDPQTSVWETRLEELGAYKMQHGHCNVPCRYKANPALGMWVKRQRRQYKLFQQGKLSNLSTDRFATLTKMGFEWEIRSKSDKRDSLHE